MVMCKHSTDIRNLFTLIAPKYDLTNALITCGCSALWYRAFIRTILQSPPPQALLDLCCGTGAVTEKLVNTMKKRNIPLPAIDCVDFSDGMLTQAYARLHNVYPRYINADAASLPLADGSYDTIIIAYGIRNLVDKKKVLSEAWRLLQPNGRLFILELTTPRFPPVRMIHSAYMKTLVPLIGGLLTRHQWPYRYLDQSIEGFSLPDLTDTLKDIGFSCSPPVPLSFGIATIIQAEKP